MKNQFITLRDGTKLYTASALGKDAKTVMIIHGGPGNGFWDQVPLAEELSKLYNVIAFDERGVNRSDPIGDDFTSEMLIDDIEEVRKYFKAEKICPVGHSYGGHLLLRYLLKYPTSVDRAIFVCPSFHFIDSLQTVLSEASELLSTGNKTLFEKVKNASEASDFPTLFKALAELPEEIQSVVYGYDLVPDEIMERVGSLMPTPEEQEKSAAHQQAVFSEGLLCRDMTDRLKEITPPTLLLVGEKDPVCSEIQRERYASCVQNGKTVTVKNSGHFPYMDHLDETVKVFHRFFS